jgi:ribosomal protein S18 acetylase RimI-like enzyme
MGIEIKPFDRTMKAEVFRFIESWSGADEHDRFGSAGIGGQQWLETALGEHGRPAFVAVHENRVIGLLDHVAADGATHFGIVVDSCFRRLAVGKALVQALLQAQTVPQPILADCSNHNRAAVALLCGAQFKRIASDGYETTWRYEG